MTKASPDDDRRQYPRFPVRAYAYLRHGEQQWETHMLDMSLCGARLALLDEHSLNPGDSINLAVSTESLGLADTQPKAIHLSGTLIHFHEHMLGVEYQPMSETDKQLLTLLLAQIE